jgi:hypothetical protein
VVAGRLQVPEHLLHLLQHAAQIFGDFGGNHVGLREVVGIEQALVFQPEQIEADLVAGQQILQLVDTPAASRGLLAPGGLALVDGTGLVEAHEFIEVGALQRVGLEGEVLVGAQVVDPEPFSAGLGTAGAAIK